jgi:hypothetical protein
MSKPSERSIMRGSLDAHVEARVGSCRGGEAPTGQLLRSLIADAMARPAVPNPPPAIRAA